MPSNFRCLLCSNAGQPTLAPRQGQTVICQDHAATLEARGRRWCNRGRHAAPVAEMRRHICRACDNLRRKAYYHANAEREKAAMRQYYEANRDARRAKIEAWQARNKDKMRQYYNAYMRRWRADNPERRRAIEYRWRAKNPERVRQMNRLNYQRSKLRILHGARRAR